MNFRLPDAHVLQQYQGKICEEQAEHDYVHTRMHSSQAVQEPAHTKKLSLRACVEARAAAAHLQELFLQWQAQAQQKQGKDGTYIAEEYKAWFLEQTQQAQCALDVAQQEAYVLWTRMQDVVYGAWARDYAAQQEHAYALTVQKNIIASSQALMRANAERRDFMQQGVEQITAAARELAYLQSLEAKEAYFLGQRQVSEALYSILLEKIESGELRLAQALLSEYKEYLLAQQVKKIAKKLRLAQKHAKS